MIQRFCNDAGKCLQRSSSARVATFRVLRLRSPENELEDVKNRIAVRDGEKVGPGAAVLNFAR